MPVARLYGLGAPCEAERFHTRQVCRKQVQMSDVLLLSDVIEQPERLAHMPPDLLQVKRRNRKRLKDKLTSLQSISIKT